jgi:uncharacterized membrane protein YeaQ/YmgE (transglycosylase-associated protein family)
MIAAGAVAVSHAGREATLGFIDWLGLDPHVIFAGCAGALSNSILSRRAGVAAAISSFIIGALTAAFSADFLVDVLRLGTKGAVFMAYCVGLSGTLVAQILMSVTAAAVRNWGDKFEKKP